MLPAIGNYVLCINASVWEDHLTLNKCYRITRHHPKFNSVICLEGQEQGFHFSRFIDLGSNCNLSDLEKAIYGIK